MIEYFVHIDPEHPPKDLVVVPVDVPDHVSRIFITVEQLPENWRLSPAPPCLAAIGDGFVAGQDATILIVPSVLVPSESNWLINPRHPASGDIRVQPPEPFRYDERLLR